jgi:hypothetical protein
MMSSKGSLKHGIPEKNIYATVLHLATSAISAQITHSTKCNLSQREWSRELNQAYIDKNIRFAAVTA